MSSEHLEPSQESNGSPPFISTDILIVVIATSVLAIALIILTTVLIVVGIYYCKKKRTRGRTTVHSQPGVLKLPVTAKEASKFFVVESSLELSTAESGVVVANEANNSSSSSANSRPTLPSLVMSSLRRMQQQAPSPPAAGAELQVISQPIILEMECNPNYHQLATEEVDGGGTDTPVSSASPLLTIAEEPSQKPNDTPTDDHTHSPPSVNVTPSESPVPPSHIPVPPTRHESLIHSYTKTSSETGSVAVSDRHKFMPRTCSDNQIRHQEESDLYGPIYSELNNRLSTSVVKTKTVLASNVKMVKNLGMGQFGLVHLGRTVGLSQQDLEIGTSDDRTQSFQVAVKVLRPNPPQSEKLAFEREVKYMSHFKHSNVVRLLAVCWGDEPFIVMEYMQYGDLQEFLQKFDSIGETTDLSKWTISHSKLVQMASEIADAMVYLASRNFIHRDLATRNCLVGDDYVVKVADFGLSRNLYDSCYYHFQGSAMLPIRWMANECFYGRFSEKSDVWAFGVTIWEIFSLCKQKPYSDKTDQQLVVETLRNTRSMLDKPSFCHDSVYEIMKQCMQTDANQRLTFEQVFKKLSQIKI